MIDTLVAIVVTAALAMAPLALLVRRAPTSRGRREAAIALHRLRLGELDRDRALGLVGPAEHGGARLEIERRLLADAALDEPDDRVGGRATLVTVFALVPLAALALYAAGGHPGWPSQPLAPRLAAAMASEQQDAAMIGELRADIAALDPHSDRAREGDLLLGQAEAARGGWNAAADAFAAALAIRFDPTIAVEAAEARTRASGRVDATGAALFRRALAVAPADAPWREMALARIAESEHAH